MPPMTATPDYVFECVFDAPSLMEAFAPTVEGDFLLERWLHEPRVRVVIPQHTLDELKHSRKYYGLPESQAYNESPPAVTLQGLDRVTNFYKNIQMELPLSRFLSTDDLQRAPRPTIHWHEFIKAHLKAHGDENALATSFNDALGFSDEFHSRFTSAEGLVSTIPQHQFPSKVLAPIGTGRPGPKKAQAAHELAVKSSAVKKTQTHAILRHMWFLMVNQEKLPVRHVWIAISAEARIKVDAKELGIPCLTFSQLRQILIQELPHLELPNLQQNKSPELSRSSSDLSLTSFGGYPRTQEQVLQPGDADDDEEFDDEGDEVVFRGKRNMGILAGAVHAPVFQSTKFPTSIVKPVAPLAGLQPSNQTAPSVPLEPRADRERRERVHKSQQLVVDPDSFERGFRGDGSRRGIGRGGYDSFVTKHRTVRSGPEPPANAPTGPSAMSRSSSVSKPAALARRSSTSPVAQGVSTNNSLPARQSQPNSPRQGTIPDNRSRNHSVHRNGQRPVSRGAASSTAPGSPLVGNNNGQSTPNGRGHRQVRSGHGTYVPPPRAREQQAKEASIITTVPIDLNQPIDPNSFGRGKAPPGEKIRLETPSMRMSQEGRRINYSRGSGGSVRGRGAPDRGRGESNNERKLFDPN